jgi:hypothetical protein
MWSVRKGGAYCRKKWVPDCGTALSGIKRTLSACGMVIVDVAEEEASGVIGGATGIHADDSRPVAA